MASFCKLCFKDSQLTNALFFIQAKKVFSRKYLIDKLKSCLAKCKIDTRNYPDNSFRCGKAQHASDFGILNKSIQKLKR